MPVDKTDCWVEGSRGVFWWPYCAVDGCENRICRNISDLYCFPHSPGNKHVKHMKIDAERGTSIKDLKPELEPTA